MAGLVAVVGAEAIQIAALEAALLAEGFIPAVFRTAVAFLKALEDEVFDLAVTADPSLVRAVRTGSRGSQTPFVLLTQDMEDDSCTAALNAGADGFVAVSAKPAVLLARIKALRRRTAGWARPPSSSLGVITLDPMRAAVIIDGEERVLTEKEFQLAALFFENPHRPLARKYLIESVWGGNVDPASRTLDTHLSRLRTKLGLTPERGFKLGPVYGYGYRLTRAAPAET